MWIDRSTPGLLYSGSGCAAGFGFAADLCYKLDKAKKRLSLSQSTNVLAESGGDAEITEIKRLVENWPGRAVKQMSGHSVPYRKSL